VKIGSLKLRPLMLHPRLRKVLRWVGYVACYLLVFVMFAYISFPYDRLKHRLIASYQATQTGPFADHLEIDDLSWSWRFPGIVAEGVRLDMAAPADRPSGPAATIAASTTPAAATPLAHEVVEAEEVFVRLSPLDLLTGARSFTFSARALGGEIQGYASDSEASRSLTLELDDIDPSGVPHLAKLIGLPLRGRISGQIALELPEGRLTKADGTLELHGEDLQIGDGKAKIRDMIVLPPIEIGALNMKAEVTGGRLKLDECAATGRDVELSMTGGLRLRQQIDASLAELEIKLGFSEKYKGQNDMTKALFGQPDSKVPGLFDTVTKTLFAKLEDGTYAARLTGPLSRLSVRPLSQRPSSSKSGRTRSKSPDGAAAADEVTLPDSEL
jgi:type II secretion system protein N